MLSTGPSSFSHLTGGANKVIWEPRGPPHHPQPTSLKPGGVFSAGGSCWGPGVALDSQLPTLWLAATGPLHLPSGEVKAQPPTSRPPAQRQLPRAPRRPLTLPRTLAGSRTGPRRRGLHSSLRGALTRHLPCARARTQAHTQRSKRSPSAEPEQWGSHPHPPPPPPTLPGGPPPSPPRPLATGILLHQIFYGIKDCARHSNY